MKHSNTTVSSSKLQFAELIKGALLHLSVYRASIPCLSPWERWPSVARTERVNNASARLVIELDGSQHYEPQGLAYDAERSQFLMSLGLEILRFSNRDIDRDFRNVCEQIDLIIQKRLQGPLSHLR